MAHRNGAPSSTMETQVDFAALISDLKTKLVATKERLAKLREARRPHALDAVSGDAKAKKAIAGLDTEVASATAEGETLAMALEEAEHRKVEHEAKLAAEDRRRREAEAREICEAILAKDRELDRAAALLHKSLTDREQLIGKLADLNVIYPGLINALRRKRSVNGAMIHAGLNQFANIELVSPDARKPLVESDKSLSNPIMTADDIPGFDETLQEGAAA